VIRTVAMAFAEFVVLVSLFVSLPVLAVVLDALVAVDP
jgi:hypothetical protein